MPEKPPSSLRSRSRPGQWFDFNVIDTRQHDKTRSPGFCVHHNEARLRLLSVMRRYVDKVRMRHAESASMRNQHKRLEWRWLERCAYFCACHSGKSTRLLRVEPNPFKA